MKVESVFDASFAPFGKVVEGYDFAPLLKTLRDTTPKPQHGTVYQPGDAALEALPIYNELTNGFYGGMPIQIGYCNGSNKTLNCLEYHRDSELNIVDDEMIFLLASLQSIKDGKLDTSAVKAFFAPAGTAVQLYETTLHYAPCNAPGSEGFRVVVVLPRGTNTDKPRMDSKNAEDALLWARNKWLLAHPESSEARQGAYVGLTGANITVE